MPRSEQSQDSVYTWKACFHVPCDTFWQLCWRSAVWSRRSPQSQIDRININNTESVENCAKDWDNWLKITLVLLVSVTVALQEDLSNQNKE